MMLEDNYNKFRHRHKGEPGVQFCGGYHAFGDHCWKGDRSGISCKKCFGDWEDVGSQFHGQFRWEPTIGDGSKPVKVTFQTMLFAHRGEQLSITQMVSHWRTLQIADEHAEASFGSPGIRARSDNCNWNFISYSGQCLVRPTTPTTTTTKVTFRARVAIGSSQVAAERSK